MTREELLGIREAQWRRQLRGVSLVAEAEIPERHRTQAAAALGVLYAEGHYTAAKATASQGVRFLTQWPSCLVAAMTGVAVTSYAQGTYWPALWEAAQHQGNADDQQIWGLAFIKALSQLGLPEFGNSQLRYVGPILMHAGMPAYCLGDFFRLLAERRHHDPGLDADAFLAWATAPGRQMRLAELDKPAQRFLLNGGEYAHDVVDRTLDLLDRLTEPDPDLDGIALPAYMTQGAKDQLAAGLLDLTGTRSAAARNGTGIARQAQPRIALDPYGAGLHVLLPAVGATPDGIARWRVTADGEIGTVQSRAMWVGAAEAAPQTVYPLNRPVRTVLVSLSGREDLAAELRVVDQTDPVLFFGEDGRRLSGTVSLPRAQVWLMHPADRELQFSGEPGQVAEPAVPFGWDGWRLRLVSLQDVQAVGLQGGRLHSVEFQARPRLLLGEPVPGVATPYGSPVFPVAPPLSLPAVPDAEIRWHVEVKRVGGASVVNRAVGVSGEIDIWQDVPRPVLGAFEVTVRGPLGRGLRRTVFIAEGLSASYYPQARLLSGTGLAQGKAGLSSAPGATVSPMTVRFGPLERSKPVEYRTDTESEPLVITPPHAALLCLGAGVNTWSTSLLHLVTEDFATAGRLLVRLPTVSQSAQPELVLFVAEQQVQTIRPSGQQSSGQVGFELARAADTVAAHGRGELVLKIGDALMPVGYVRPRRLTSGIDLVEDRLVLRDAAVVDGLTVGVYLAYAPWRRVTEIPVLPDGSAALPEELVNAGPLRVLPRIDDPWAVATWPAWPGASAYACPASGVPISNDPEEEAISRFVAGEDGLPELKEHLGWLWRLVDLSVDLVRLGARADLTEKCTEELRRQSRAALLALAAEDLGHADVVRALIVTGLTAAPCDTTPWSTDDLRVLERLWAAFPAAAAVVCGELLDDPSVAELATAHCGASLDDILHGRGDIYAAVGRFGPEAERMARLPADQVEALWQAAGVVPRALLDADTRLAAARRMFDAKNVAAMRASAEQAKFVVHGAERLIAESRYPDLAEAISARQPTGSKGWLALPAMSIAMALIARLAAHDNARCAELEREYRGKWSNLALSAPDLVAIDLTRAEALVVAAMRKSEENPHD